MASVFLADIDDYIAPSQACINPLFSSDKGTPNSLAVENGREEEEEDPNAKSKSKNRDKNNSTGDGSSIVRTRNKTAVRRRVRRRAVNNGDDGGVINRVTAGGSIRLTVEDDNCDDIPSLSSSTTTTAATAGDKKQGEPAKLSIADCLSCSGCVTSAEAVLVTEHSLQTLKKNCSNPDKEGTKIVMFTISPASIADLYRYLYLEVQQTTSSSTSLSLLEKHDAFEEKGGEKAIHSSVPTPTLSERSVRLLYRRLTTFLHNTLNATVVLDASIPLQLSLIESAEEFCHRYRTNFRSDTSEQSYSNRIYDNARQEKGEEKKEGNMATNPNNAAINTTDKRIIDYTTPSIALSATETRYILSSSSTSSKTDAITIQHEPGRFSPPQQQQQQQQQEALPMLSSSCPGFVCYVEKTTPHVIPNLSTVKSPMSIGGYIAKHLLFPSSAASGSTTTTTTTGAVMMEKNTKPLQDGNEHTDNNGNDGVDFNVRGSSNNDTAIGVDHQTQSLPRSLLYHVALMPCHDKKLEAGRKDLSWEVILPTSTTSTTTSSGNTIVPDVDLVITTDELLQLLREETVSKTSDKAKQQQQQQDLLSSMMDHNQYNVRNFIESIPPIRDEDVLDWSTGSLRDIIDAVSERHKNEKGYDEKSDTLNVSSLSFSAPLSSSSSSLSSRPMLIMNTCQSRPFQIKGEHHEQEQINDTQQQQQQQQQQEEGRKKDGLNQQQQQQQQKQYHPQYPQDGMVLNGSGGYAEFIFRYAARSLFGHVIPQDRPLPWKVASLSSSPSLSSKTTLRRQKMLRNSIDNDSTNNVINSNILNKKKKKRNSKTKMDLCEVTLYRHGDGTYSCYPRSAKATRGEVVGEEGDESELGSFTTTKEAEKADGDVPVLKFATAYGFKNVQLMLQKVTKKSNNDKNNRKKGDGWTADSGTMAELVGTTSPTGPTPNGVSREMRRSIDQCNSSSSDAYHYIEVMACPSGCLNGGGQIRRDVDIVVPIGITATTGVNEERFDSTTTTTTTVHRQSRRETPAETRERVWKNQSVMNVIHPDRIATTIMEKEGMDSVDTDATLLVSKFYDEPQKHSTTTTATTSTTTTEKNTSIFPSVPFGKESKRVLHTRYHVVPKLELTTGATAGVALSDTKW